jgi:parvulin-like peptidyl-prolyl isomerase
VQLTATYTEKTDSGAWFRRGELSPALDSLAFGAKVGDLIGPTLEADGYHLSKILDEKKSDKDYVRASHILFQLEGEKDTNAVKATAQEVAKWAKGGKDFAVLAKKYSKDPGSAGRGGDLGWFTKGRMVKEFENAVFKMRVGEIVGPVRTQFGLHVIKLNVRDSREVKIANIILRIEPSSQTKNDVFERARDFAYNARESEFNKEAQSTGIEVKESQVQEKGGFVPGIGVNESITRWAFKSDVGDVSEPFSIPNGYVVLTVVEIKNASVKPFDEVKEGLKPLVMRKKKMAILTEEKIDMEIFKTQNENPPLVELSCNDLISLLVEESANGRIGTESRQELINRGKDDIKERISIKKLFKNKITDIETLLKKFNEEKNNKISASLLKNQFLTAISLLDRLQLEWQKYDISLKK